MHRLAATPGGWTPDTEGVIFVDQTPAPIVLITAADTDINAIAQAMPYLPANFPALRVVNLLQLQQQLSIDTYAETVLEKAQVIVLRLLGGRSYWSYGLEVVRETVERTGATLIVLPGDNQPDPTLISHSTLAIAQVNQCWRYFLEGGVENMVNALRWLAHHSISNQYEYEPPQPVPSVGVYPFHISPAIQNAPQVGIVFYRAHYLAGNLAPIDALCQALSDRDLHPVPIFVSSLRDPDVQAELLHYFRPKDEAGIQVLLNTTSFSLAQLGERERGDETTSDFPELWQRLNVPVLQVILSGGGLAQWQQEWRGLSPRDVAMNVALPEVDGRIISRAVSFKAVQGWNAALETEVLNYQPVDDRIQFVADLAANWAKLRQANLCDRKVALILANYPTRNGRLANGVGLDTPASCVAILQAMKQAGYHVENIPETDDELIRRLTAGITNDPETKGMNPVEQTLSVAAYQAWFDTLPETVKTQVNQRWGDAQDSFAIAGIQLGNIFVGIQPSRGYEIDPALNYHAPDLEPTHDYLAFYHWLRSDFGTHAIVHVGKHGNLEWLPGKSVALSQDCYPEVAFGAIPHLYPFIVNDPGEGSQAKRRSQAVIIDHLTPPMTRAELYGGLQQLEGLIDEYYEAQTLDPSRLAVIRDRMTALIQQENLSQEVQAMTGEVSIAQFTPAALTELITNADRYLCELKESQIRDGLHIFGQCPTGRQLRDLIVSIARHPSPGRLGLTRAIAQAWELDFDPLMADPALLYSFTPPLHHSTTPSPRTIGDAVDLIENFAADQVEQLLNGGAPLNDDEIAAELNWIRDRLLPDLHHTEQEMYYLLHGLAGGYVPAAPSGAPTRGRPDVLPTGRNFYSVDIRAVPTESAWDVGRKAAEVLIEAYTQEHGEYPKTLALSIWGTSTMRTGGDDLAEALALLGVQPVWEGASRRVIDFEVLPLSILGRPRVDVTLRISGFFRDAFPNLIDLFDQAVTAVAALNESADGNPLAAQVQQETQEWQQAGLTVEQAEQRSRYRVFGSKPGAYGAGLQGLIESQNWETTDDFARAYLNWSSYAYSAQGVGYSAPEAFERRLTNLQIVLQNQDNREHDLLDSDDYYQFQGGLTAAVRSLQGQNPTVYFGDHSLPENPKVRSLQQEIARVYRSRVVNPKWIAGAMRHGYKGAFEMAATIDYMFAYDATAQCVTDYMYEGVAEAYVLDPQVQAFVQQKNPWALRDITERLLEAHQRGMWENVDQTMLDQLRSLSLEAEAEIEGRLGSIGE
ncbi:cobaltochelatase subunit CobN [Phormidium sp. CLA17]|uniref:cobaltochelatase subunit CobN n=1 Tax=Leptolyngbya sp. Cla-17 TaxID=2803751 RepID=UPI00149326DE|nr:cobaltochelatase subunit CobN [Leptolyngbya sp. Cla-17]MBM0741287.1 cobaltochelatase subunit CobN [Leptolyngbya sp. Cla-17]